MSDSDQPIVNVAKILIARASTVVPQLRDVTVQRCHDVDVDYELLPRNHMHVGHRSGVICYGAATEQLSLSWQVGLLVHELGHLAGFALGIDHDENGANELGRKVTGIKVYWRGPLLIEWARTPKWLRKELGCRTR